MLSECSGAVDTNIRGSGGATCFGTMVMAVIAAPDRAAAADCPVGHEQLASALKASVKASGGPSDGGFDPHQWASVVTRDGTVCAVASSVNRPDDQWPGSRVVAMAKARSANAFSGPTVAPATANLFAPAQPGQSLYGIVQVGPPSPEALAGDGAQFGTPSDPALGRRIGGIVAFGGGPALHNEGGIIGGLGVSGASSCAEHGDAWRVSQALGLDRSPQTTRSSTTSDPTGRAPAASGPSNAPATRPTWPTRSGPASAAIP